MMNGLVSNGPNSPFYRAAPNLDIKSSMLMPSTRFCLEISNLRMFSFVETSQSSADATSSKVSTSFALILINGDLMIVLMSLSRF